MYHSAPQLNDKSRFGLCVLMALLAHAFVVFAVKFKADFVKPPLQSHLEVTLVLPKNLKKNLKPDFLANVDQAGSGTKEKKHIPSSNAARRLPGVLEQLMQAPPQVARLAPPSSARDKIIVAQLTDKAHHQEHAIKNTKIPAKHATQRHSTQQTNTQIAELEEKFKKLTEAYAKRPRIHRVTAASTQADIAAYYKDAWRRRVEKVGNLNYPEKAKTLRLYGSLRILVSVNASGALHTIKILKSSGKSILDHAAIRIVKLAAPFPPFEGNLAKQVDRLELIRTWRFEKGYYLTSN